MVEPTREQSEFNMAVSFLNRLNGLSNAINIAKMTLDANVWLSALICLYSELTTEMKDNEIEDGKKEIRNLKEMVAQNTAYNMRCKRMEVSDELFFKLLDFELRLRKVIRESGIQMKIKDDFLDAEEDW
jgi:hypothetical protein